MSKPGVGKNPNSIAARKAHEFKPGQKNIPNREGNNQYSYRRNFENAINDLLNNKPSAKELQALGLPTIVLEAVPKDATRAEILALGVIFRSMGNDIDNLKESLARIWPKTQDINANVNVTDADPDALASRLARLAAARGEDADHSEPPRGGKRRAGG